METVTTEQGNKLIAEFMGATHEPQSDRYNEHLLFEPEVAPPVWYVGHDREWHTRNERLRVAILDLSNLKYHSSWDWLMPVVEKIELAGYEIEITSNYVRITEGTPQGDGGKYFKIIADVDSDTMVVSIRTLWLAVIDFLTYLNKMK